MAKVNLRNLTSPLAAAAMAIILGTYIYSAMGHARLNAAVERKRMYEEATVQRRNLSSLMDARYAERSRSGKDKIIDR